MAKASCSPGKTPIWYPSLSPEPSHDAFPYAAEFRLAETTPNPIPQIASLFATKLAGTSRFEQLLSRTREGRNHCLSETGTPLPVATHWQHDPPTGHLWDRLAGGIDHSSTSFLFGSVPHVWKHASDLNRTKHTRLTRQPNVRRKRGMGPGATLAPSCLSAKGVRFPSS